MDRATTIRIQICWRFECVQMYLNRFCSILSLIGVNPVQSSDFGDRL
jgi:hypothetical protein